MAIQELPTQVANQIAAGEVVERPASVVKELVENAIDANASEIIVSVEEAGLRAIQITDNGQGMSTSDAQLAFKRHATSKIHSHHDLFRIRTLGFRGEALPSIASVSEIHLETSDGHEGTELTLNAGEIVDQQSSHLRQGTTIRVENLFFNTPARLKYVKSLQTELSHITDIINREALSHPDIRFIYEHDGKSLLETNGKGRVEEVLSAIYGYHQAKQLLPIKDESLNFEVTGFVSNPSLTRASKNYLSLFVNGRYIKNYVLNQAILKGYGSKLMIGRYPIAAIYITLDPQLVDVNVHPTKQEVRISSEDDLYHLIQQSVDQAITPVQRIPSTGQETPNVTIDNKALGHQQVSTEKDRGVQSRLDFNSQSVSTSELPAKEKILDDSTQPPTTNYAQEQSNESDNVVNEDHFMPEYLKPYAHEKQEIKDASSDQGTYLNTEELESVPTNHQSSVWRTVKLVQQTDEQSFNNQFPDLVYAGQIQGTYLACYNETGMYLVDQHAAQERIKYEYYREAIALQGQDLQNLLIPYVLEFTQAEKQKIDQMLPRLADMGIILEPFGNNSYALQKHPLWMGNKNIEHIVEELIQLALDDPDATVKDYREATAIMMSCKRSIKANHHLDASEANQLLNDLAHTTNPYNCPHGRPVLIHFSNYEIERLFKRIQDPHQSPKD